MQTKHQPIQKNPEPKVHNVPFKHNEKAQKIINQLTSGEMRFIC